MPKLRGSRDEEAALLRTQRTNVDLNNSPLIMPDDFYNPESKKSSRSNGHSRVVDNKTYEPHMSPKPAEYRSPPTDRPQRRSEPQPQRTHQKPRPSTDRNQNAPVPYTGEARNIEHQNFGGQSRYRKQERAADRVRYFSFSQQFLLVIKSVFYLAVIAADTYAAYIYYVRGDNYYFIVTVTIAAAGIVTCNILSLRWHWQDVEEIDFLTLVAHVFLTSPVFRCIQTMIHGGELNKNPGKDNFDILHADTTDVAVVSLVHTFISSASQLVVQLYIIWLTQFENPREDLPLYVPLISCAGSAINTLLTLVIYIRTLQTNSWPQLQIFAHNAKIRVTHFFKNLMLIISYLCLLGSRIVALVVLLILAGSQWQIALAIILAHWFVMWIWLISQNTKYTGSRVEEVMFCAVIAWIYVFLFFSMVPGKVRRKLFMYYLICLLENLAITFYWFYTSENNTCPDFAEKTVEGSISALQIAGVINFDTMTEAQVTQQLSDGQKLADELNDKFNNIANEYNDGFNLCANLFVVVIFGMIITSGIGSFLNIFYYLCCDPQRTWRNCWQKEKETEETADEKGDRLKRARQIGASNEDLLNRSYFENPERSCGAPPSLSKQVHVSNSYGNRRLQEVADEQHFSSQYDVGTTERQRNWVRDQYDRTVTQEHLDYLNKKYQTGQPGTMTQDRLIQPQDALDSNSLAKLSTVRDFHSLSRTNRSDQQKLKRRNSYKRQKTLGGGSSPNDPNQTFELRDMSSPPRNGNHNNARKKVHQNGAAANEQAFYPSPVQMREISAKVQSLNQNVHAVRSGSKENILSAPAYRSGRGSQENLLATNGANVVYRSRPGSFENLTKPQYGYHAHQQLSRQPAAPAKRADLSANKRKPYVDQFVPGRHGSGNSVGISASDVTNGYIDTHTTQRGRQFRFKSSKQSCTGHNVQTQLQHTNL